MFGEAPSLHQGFAVYINCSLPIPPLVGPIKSRMNVTQIEMDDFEANGFSLSNQMIELPTIQIGSTSEEALPSATFVPSLRIVDIQSMRLVLVCSQIIF